MVAMVHCLFLPFCIKFVDMHSETVSGIHLRCTRGSFTLNLLVKNNLYIESGIVRFNDQQCTVGESTHNHVVVVFFPPCCYFSFDVQLNLTGEK